MPFLTVRTVFIGVTGSPWINTLNFQATGPAGTQAEADAAVVTTGTYWGATDAVMSTAVSWATLPEVLAHDDAGVALAAYATTPQTGVGASAAEIMPFSNQALIRLLTGAFIGGRQLRGRIFVPGLTETANSSGSLISTTASTLLAAANALNAATAPALAVWSRTHAAVATVTGVSVWSQFAVLRSRRD